MKPHFTLLSLVLLSGCATLFGHGSAAVQQLKLGQSGDFGYFSRMLFPCVINRSILLIY